MLLPFILSIAAVRLVKLGQSQQTEPIVNGRMHCVVCWDDSGQPKTVVGSGGVY